MGGSQSIEVPGGGTEGYHVLRVSCQLLLILVIYYVILQVQEHSPGYKAGLQAYFDFIVAIGNTRLVSDLMNNYDQVCLDGYFMIIIMIVKYRTKTMML